MPPVEVVGVVGLAGLDDELALAIDLGNVFKTGTGLGEGNVAVLDYGSGSGVVQGLVLIGGEERSSLVVFEGVIDAELFAEPGNSLGLRDLQVVDCERHGGGLVMMVVLEG